MLAEKPDDKRNALKVLLIDDNESERSEIHQALVEMGEPELDVSEAGAQMALAMNGGSGAEVAMVAFDGEDETCLEYLQAQSQSSHHPVLFALLRDRSSNVMRRALRAGADEVLFLPLDQGDCTRALLKISEARRRAERPGRGIICSLVSLTGGAGVTSLTANLALALRQANRQVAVVDLDLQSSDLSVLLNIEPEHTIAELADPTKKLDSIQLESSLSKHSSGMYLLAAPKRVEDSEQVNAGQVGAALDLMRQLFDVVLVDVGRHLNEVSIAVWERSDHLFYVLDQSISAVRCAWRFIDLFSRLGLSNIEPAFILNRHNLRHSISEEQIIHTLARQIHTKVPRDDKAFELALTRAQDLWSVAPGSPVCKSLDELARKIAGIVQEAAPDRTSSLLHKLFASVRPAQASA